jgi:hypothetical protein
MKTNRTDNQAFWRTTLALLAIVIVGVGSVAVLGVMTL